MTIYLGADHNGFAYKQHIADFLKRSGYEVVDVHDGPLDPADDFPLFAGQAVQALLADGDKHSRAILVCGSGQGMCMAANRFKGVYASLCWNVAEARSARNDDNSNVLCLSASQMKLEELPPIITTWLQTPFAGADRFVRRLKELDELV